MDQRRFVYILRSDVDPDRYYVGITSDVEARLRWHNSGPSGVTIRNRPWSLVVTLEFADTKLGSVRTVSENRIWTGVRPKRHFGREKAPDPSARGLQQACRRAADF